MTFSTLVDSEDCGKKSDKPSTMLDLGAPAGMKMADISQTLLKAMQIARLDNRLTTGINACANILECCPDTVLLCILTAGTQDVTEHILTTLIEAYCSENFIPILKVSDDLKSLLVDGRKGSACEPGCAIVQVPSPCILSAAEDELLDFSQHSLDIYPQPIITEPAG